MELSHQRLLYAKGGSLFATNLEKDGRAVRLEPPRDLANFDDMIFEAIEAPPEAEVW